MFKIKYTPQSPSRAGRSDIRRRCARGGHFVGVLSHSQKKNLIKLDMKANSKSKPFDIDPKAWIIDFVIAWSVPIRNPNSFVYIFVDKEGMSCSILLYFYHSITWLRLLLLLHRSGRPLLFNLHVLVTLAKVSTPKEGMDLLNLYSWLTYVHFIWRGKWSQIGQHETCFVNINHIYLLPSYQPVA